MLNGLECQIDINRKMQKSVYIEMDQLCSMFDVRFYVYAIRRMAMMMRMASDQ